MIFNGECVMSSFKANIGSVTVNVELGNMTAKKPDKNGWQHQGYEAGILR